MMRSSRDYLYLIFVGFLLYFAGAVILGGIEYFINLYIGIDFISIILYYIITNYLAKQILKGIDIRNRFVSIYLMVLTVLMYIIKDYVSFVVVYTVEGMPLLTMISYIPKVMLAELKSYFQFSLSIDGIFQPILNLFYLAIEVLIMFIAARNVYITSRRM